MSRAIRITEARSGLDVLAVLLDDRAPANAAFLWRYCALPRVVPALHAIWTGPEISCPVPPAHLAGDDWPPLPPENATLHPQPGDVALAWVPARMWGGAPDPIHDIGLFYGPGARMLLPIGWLAVSIAARVPPEQHEALAAACARIRRNGAADIAFAREGEGG